MKIKIDSMITIENPSKEIKDYCKNNLVIKNPDVQKKQIMGFWTGNIPRTLKMFSINDGNYILPIGEIDNVWRLHPIKQDYEIDFGEHKKIDFPENKMKLYDYQEEAVNKMIKAKRGILSSKCGSGKSIMLLEMIRRIGYKALIICEKKEIQLQFRDYLVNCFGMKQGDYGLISEGNLEIGKYITIGLRQTLARVDLTPYKYEFGTIAVDEGQNVGGSVTKCTQYSKILNNLAAEYRFAVSATAYRVDGLTRCMYSLLNTIKYKIPEDAVEDKTIKAKIQSVLTNYEIPDSCLKWDGTLNYTELPTAMAENTKRNELIVKYLKENKNNYCLILSDRLSSLENLHALLGEGLLINGSMTSKKAKKEREDAIEKMRQKQEHYLFASYNLAREGLDIKPLDRLFLVAPTKNKISLIQSVRQNRKKR